MSDNNIFDKKDVSYEDALAFIYKKGFISISMLQREFHLTYNAAARIQERMLQEGRLSKHLCNIYKLKERVDEKRP